MTGQAQYMGSLSGEALIAGMKSGGEPGQLPTESDDGSWHYITPSTFDLAIRSVQMKGQIIGKIMTWCRCDGFTSHAERIEIAKAIQNMFARFVCVRPDCKIAIQPDVLYNSNMVPMLFYCGKDESKSLVKILTSIGPSLLPKRLWDKVPGQARAMTLNASFKSNGQTMAEVASGTHYTQKIR